MNLGGMNFVCGNRRCEGQITAEVEEVEDGKIQLRCPSCSRQAIFPADWAARIHPGLIAGNLNLRFRATPER